MAKKKAKNNSGSKRHHSNKDQLRRHHQRKHVHPPRHLPDRHPLLHRRQALSSSSKSASAEAHSGQLRYRPWSAQGPVYIGETFQDPKDGTIIRVAHSSNGSRLNDVRKEVDKKWSRKHYCCNDVSCRICADYCRTTRANLCLSVVKCMRKVDKPNGPKFKQIVDSILRNR